MTLKIEILGEDCIPATKASNAEIIRALNEAPNQWSFAPAEIRRRRREGHRPFPRGPLSDLATVMEIEGPHGAIQLRVFKADAPKGVYLHIHGGGWTLGGADFQDMMLERLMRSTGFTVVSVEYRLAPEFPYPYGADDCEAAAIWLAANGAEIFGTGCFVIGGESAGAQLSVVTLVRLRDRHDLRPFKGALLCAGCHDLRMSASARNWGSEKLILTTYDTSRFIGSFLQGASADQPDVSPILADIKGLPPALFMVGTRDPLEDDTMMMAARWSIHNKTELAVFHEGAHVFVMAPGPLADLGISRMEQFLVATAASDDK